MLRNHAIIESDVDEVLDVYFKQCSILVTTRDLAVMAATLANRGINPVTNEQVVEPYAVARTLSVMTSSGMYDYAGEWVYRVGIPAKSGVGGGIIAALPAQLGLGTFSPLLDSHGNSVRGMKVCEELSSHFNLHVLNRSGDVRTSIIADYDIEGIASRRGRQPHEQEILDAHPRDIRVIELIGALSIGTMDYVTRQIAAQTQPALLIIDLRRVPSVTEGAARLLNDELNDLAASHVRVVLCGIEKTSPVWNTISTAIGDINLVRRFDLLDDAIEWAEDQVIYRYGGFSTVRAPMPLDEQALLMGLSPAELNELTAICSARTFHTGERIIAAGDPAASIFFLRSGMISVKLPSGVRLASLAPGMAFGEMALLEDVRTADVWADTLVDCLELDVDRFDAFCERHPRSGQRIVRNLASLLTKRLIAANAKVDVLSAY
jgi:glutaminase